ncbi:serine hydrolase, partial [Rhodococcus erythropolis]|nr:serine hydrolase [Rhodococcus erythropolis]
MKLEHTRRKSRPLTLVALASAAVFALAACTSGPDSAQTSDNSTKVSATETPTTVTIPDSPVGKQISWLLSAFNTSAPLP